MNQVSPWLSTATLIDPRWLSSLQILAYQLTREKLVQGRYQMLVQAEEEGEEEEEGECYRKGEQCGTVYLCR